MAPRTTLAVGLSLLAGASALACLAACVFVLIQVPQHFSHVRTALGIASCATACSAPLAVVALLLAPRRVLPNLALAGAVLAIALWGTTSAIEHDARISAAGHHGGAGD